MEIIYTKEDLKGLIKNYYSEAQGRSVDVSINVKSELVGYYEDLACISAIKISEHVNILGKSTIISQVITKEEVIRIISELLESEGYSLETLEYLDGIKTEWKGYGLGEYQEKKPYFKGVKLVVSKNNSLKRGRYLWKIKKK